MFLHKKFTIHSPFSPEVVRQKLLEVVEPPQMGWGRNQSAKPYQGEIGAEVFRIARNIQYRNSFLPIITGRIQWDGLGSQIDIQMKLHPFVLVFMCIWLGMVGQVALLFLVATLGEGKFEPTFLIPCGMFAFGLLLPWVGFEPEANKAKQFLIDLLS